MGSSEETGWVVRVALTSPGLGDNTADVERLAQALERQQGAPVDIPLELARLLPAALREAGYAVRCVVGRDRRARRLIGVAPASGTRRLVGAAVDLGTTRVVLRLVDLETSGVLATQAFDNPQARMGPDILARIHQADHEDGLAQLQALVVDGLNQALGRACAGRDFAPRDVALAVIAGNTTMAHLLLGLPPRWLIREPYIPVVNAPRLAAAAALGLQIGPGAGVFVFPNVGSYFGGDLIAGILCAGLDRRDEPAVLVDVGTNAEVVLGTRDWLVGCAGAAGPALEAGAAAIGMLAEQGVIDKVWWDPQAGELGYHVIGEGRPRGICGSGLIDLAAALYRAGMIDLRGRLVPAACGDRCRETDGTRELVLVPAEASATGRALVIDQHGLTSLKKAKAAMFAILETLTASVGMTPEEVGAFFVAGSFGSVIDPASAITIGMLPDLPRERFRVLGNASLEGATRLVQDASLVERVYAVRDRITYMELNVNQDFMNRFSGAQFFPHTDPDRFPSVAPPRSPGDS